MLILMTLISDIRTFKIKNKIIYPFVLSGIITNSWQNGYEGLGLALQGAALPIVLLFVFFLFRILGAGDIKLFSAIGAIMGPGFVLYTIVYSFLAGGVLALAIILVRENCRERFGYLLNYLKYSLLTLSLKPYIDFSGENPGGKLPFALAVTCGVLLKFLFDYP